MDREHVAIPALLALSAVHHHLVREGLRTTAGLVVETGSAREVHHFARAGRLRRRGRAPVPGAGDAGRAAPGPAGRRCRPTRPSTTTSRPSARACRRSCPRWACRTYMSYCGAQLFEAIGLEKPLVDKYFRGTASQIGGIGVFQVAEEALRMHRAAFGNDPVLADMLDAGGEYAWRVRGEEHMWTPDAIAKLQHSARSGKFETYKEYAQIINDQSKRHMTLRGLFEFKVDPAKAIPLDEVEPAAEIVKRFATGAMSLGSISTEAHSTLAVAMNRIGGKSNTGEGGEDPARYRNEMKGIPIAAGTKVSDVIGAKVIEADYVLQAGDSLRSKIKQVASGRFGVTTEYLVSADQIQIKMAQGAKPGEGGQLPGGKVSEYIGFLRYSVPGVGLISPAAAPRHLFDRGPGAADPRPEERQPARRHQRQAGVRGGRGHHRRGRGQVQGRPCGDRRPRRRHRRVAVEQHQACRHALGAGPGRDPADAGAEPPAQPHPRAGRRPDEDRPRRGHRRAARCRRVRLRHRAAGGRRLHHDAQVPPQHLPGGRGHAGPGAARQVHRQARACGQLLLLRRRRSAPDHGAAGHPQVRRPDRPRRPARHAQGHRALEGQGPGLQPHLPPAQRAGRGAAPPGRDAGPRPGTGAGRQADRAAASRPSSAARRCSSWKTCATSTAASARCCRAS